MVQDSTPLDGGGGHKKRKPLNQPYPDVGPVALQDHGNPVRYRNIWLRPLRPRPADGGTDGRLSAAATTAKRAEIGAEVRASAANMQGWDQMMRLLESQMYASNSAAWDVCNRQVSESVEQFKDLSTKELEIQRQQVMDLHHALSYLQRFDIIAADYKPAKELREIADGLGWLKQK